MLRGPMRKRRRRRRRSVPMGYGFGALLGGCPVVPFFFVVSSSSSSPQASGHPLLSSPPSVSCPAHQTSSCFARQNPTWSLSPTSTTSARQPTHETARLRPNESRGFERPSGADSGEYSRPTSNGGSHRRLSRRLHVVTRKVLKAEFDIFRAFVLLPRSPSNENGCCLRHQ